MKNELKTNWEEEKKKGKKPAFRIRISIFEELWDKQLNYYGLIRFIKIGIVPLLSLTNGVLFTFCFFFKNAIGIFCDLEISSFC